jgi:hypothetical protein
MGFGVGIAALGFLAATLVSIVVWGGVTHGMLCLLTSPAAGPRRTYQALCYSGGANLLTAVPCLGMYVGSVWWVVSAIVMVKDGQRVTGGRAALAVLTFPILAFGAIVTFYVWQFVWFIPSMAPGSWGMQVETRYVLDAIVSYAEDHRGHGPGHACELLVGEYLTADDFVILASDTMVADAQVGDITLAQFANLAVDRRIMTAKQVADALPDDTVAHRLGDYVFTYHGVDLADPDPRLWVVICWPDPDVNTANMSQNFVYVGMANGATDSLPPGTFAATLAQQNSNRARAGLAPLPDPQTVTHGRPARAGKIEN